MCIVRWRRTYDLRSGDMRFWLINWLTRIFTNITNRFTENRLLHSHCGLSVLVRRRMRVDVRCRLISGCGLTAFEQV